MTIPTREKLIDEANLLMRDRGYSAFSYADLSKKIGISKASIHHHFASKEILGEQVVIAAYKETEHRLNQIYQENLTAMGRLACYMNVFAENLQTSQLPLCCALSAELSNLPDTVKRQTTDYFHLQIDWLTKILKEGKDAAEFKTEIDENKTALTILSLFEGTSIVARVLNNLELFQQSLEQIKTLIQPK